MNDGRGSPLENHLREDGPAAELGGGLDGPDEVGGKLAAIRFGKYVQPRALFGQRTNGIVGRQMGQRVSQSPGGAERADCRSLGGVFTHEQQRYAVPTSNADVTLIGERSDALGVALQLAPLHL